MAHQRALPFALGRGWFIANVLPAGARAVREDQYDRRSDLIKLARLRRKCPWVRLTIGPDIAVIWLRCQRVSPLEKLSKNCQAGPG